MAGEGEVPNPPTLLAPPFSQWFPGYFYFGKQLFPGVICWHHSDICLVVEYNMRCLRCLSQPQTAEEEEEEEERKIREKRATELQRRYLMTSTAAEKKMGVEVLVKKMAEEVLEKKIPDEVLEKKMAEELLEKKKMPEEEVGRKYKRRRK